MIEPVVDEASHHKALRRIEALTACPPTTKNSAFWALSDVQSSIQSGSMAVVVAEPESVQFGADAQAFFGGHSGYFRALDTLGFRVSRARGRAVPHELSSSFLRTQRRSSSARKGFSRTSALAGSRFR